MGLICCSGSKWVRSPPIRSVSVQMEPSRFNTFWSGFSEEVLRAKSALWICRKQERHVFLIVGQRFAPAENRWLGPMRNRLVLIGRSLKSCLADCD